MDVHAPAAAYVEPSNWHAWLLQDDSVRTVDRPDSVQVLNGMLSLAAAHQLHR